jgi:hypothetical protein
LEKGDREGHGPKTDRSITEKEEEGKRREEAKEFYSVISYSALFVALIR